MIKTSAIVCWLLTKISKPGENPANSKEIEKNSLMCYEV